MLFVDYLFRQLLALGEALQPVISARCQCSRAEARLIIWLLVSSLGSNYFLEMTASQSFHYRNENQRDVMEIPDRGPSLQSSTVEKPDCQSDVPFTIDRKLPRKATHNPNALPHRDDAGGDDYYLGDLYDNKINRDLWAVDT